MGAWLWPGEKDSGGTGKVWEGHGDRGAEGGFPGRKGGREGPQAWGRWAQTLSCCQVSPGRTLGRPHGWGRLALCPSRPPTGRGHLRARVEGVRGSHLTCGLSQAHCREHWPGHTRAGELGCPLPPRSPEWVGRGCAHALETCRCFQSLPPPTPRPGWPALEGLVRMDSGAATTEGAWAL